MIKNFKELIVWQKSIELTRTIYSETSAFPKNEEFSLTSQLRRSPVSVPSNISEGCKRKITKKFNNSINISILSLDEIETQELLTHHFKNISSENVEIIYH